MNALEKIEKQQEEIKVLAERLYEIHEILQRILPIVDGIVEVVGREPVLQAAQKLTAQQRDTHVATLLAEYEKRASAGEFKEGEEVAEESVLFVSERAVGDESASMRVLPVQALTDDVRKSVTGIKVGDLVDPEMKNGVAIKVERIFTPVSA